MPKKGEFKDYEYLRQQIDNLNEKGLCRNAIARELNIPNTTFRLIISRLGINLKHKGSVIYKNHSYFDIIDTPEKAYILGFIVADGCISIEPKKNKNKEIYAYSQRLTFSQSIDDLDVVEKIAKEIAPDSKIKHFYNNKGAKNRKPQISLRINSTPICQTLVSKYNIHPRKTWDIDFQFPFQNISKKLHSHFIRGFFDGDGWISKDGIAGFVATSLPFIKQIASILKNEIQTNYKIRSSKGKNMIVHQLHLYSIWGSNIRYLGKNEKKEEKRRFIRDLYQYLYKDATIFLKRKRDKLEEVIDYRTSEENKLTLQNILNGEGFICES